MHINVKRTLAALGGATLLGALAVPAAAQFGGPPPPPNTGVPLDAGFGDGGHVTLVVDPPKGQVCWMSYRLGASSAELRAGEGGAALVRLAPLAGGCTQIAEAQGQAVVDNPAGHAVVIDGVRATLTK